VIGSHRGDYVVSESGLAHCGVAVVVAVAIEALVMGRTSSSDRTLQFAGEGANSAGDRTPQRAGVGSDGWGWGCTERTVGDRLERVW